MSRVHRRGVIAGPKGGGAMKTYADFVAWAATQGGTDVDALAWPAGVGGGSGLKRFTLPATLSGGMIGSSWGGSPAFGEFNGGSQYTRICQHAFATEAHLLMNLGRLVLMDIQDQGYNGAKASVTRWGYSSIANADVDTWTCTRFDYFSETTKKRVRVNPYTQTATEFDL